MRKTYRRKTYREIEQHKTDQARTVRALLSEFIFRPEPLLTFLGGSNAQAAFRAVSLADAGDRYLVICKWPDVQANPYKSRWSALGPPGQEDRAAQVAFATRIWLAEQSGRECAAHGEAHP